MKYLIILILLLVSCITSNTTGEATISSRVSQVYYDGCQYITTSEGGITHKGNCSNSAHKSGGTE